MFLNLFLSKRKYFNKIFLWITLFVIIITIVFAATLFFSVEKTILENTNKTNRQVLSQIEYNISYMDDFVKNLCASIYYNPDAVYLMSSTQDNDNIYNSILKMEHLRTSYINANTFIHSIYIYNSKLNTYFSSYNGINYKDDFLIEKLKKYKTIPVRTPIYRKIQRIYKSHGKDYDDVFTYVMYDTIDSQDNIEDGIYLNIKTDWVMDNIKNINMLSANVEDKAYILNDKKEFIGDGIGDTGFIDELRDLFNSKNFTYDKGYEFIKSTINGKDYYISALHLQKLNWILLKVQPYNEVYRNVVTIKITIIVILIIFVIIAGIVSLLISKKIYNPIGDLVGSLKNKSHTKNSNIDEISYLNDLYINMSSEIDEYKKEKNSNQSILKIFYYRKLLVEGEIASIDDIKNMMDQQQSILDFAKGFLICVLRIDNYKEFVSKNERSDQELYKFVIINIACEVYSSHFICDAIDMKNDQIVVLINIDQYSTFSYNCIIEDTKSIQQHLLKYFNLSLSVSFSEPINVINYLSRGYYQAFNNSHYKYIFGKKSIITPQMVQNNVENRQMAYSFKNEAKFRQELKNSNLKNAEEILQIMLKEISKLNYSNIMLSVIHIASAINDEINETNKKSTQKFNIDFDWIGSSISEFETIEEFYEKAMEFIRNGVNSNNDILPKYVVLVDTIKDLVHENYSSSSLCSAQIADMLKMSTSYITRIFKESIGISISDYINDVRLERALELLNKSSLNVNQIMHKVGIENESNFYRQFKKRYGNTPREYLIKNITDK